MIGSLGDFIKPYRSHRLGITLDNLKGIVWSADLHEGILTALRGEGHGEISIALFLIEAGFLNGSLGSARGTEIVGLLWSLVPDSCSRTMSEMLRTIRKIGPESAAGKLGQLTAFLSHESPLVRLEAVRWVGALQVRCLYPLLLQLREDPHFGEVNMGGRLEFDVRNEAFRVLADVLNIKESGWASDIVPSGATVHYRDWTPIVRRASTLAPRRKWFRWLGGK